MRALVKRVLAFGRARGAPGGATLLIYHRVGARTPDERDVSTSAFAEQVAALPPSSVLSLDEAITRLQHGDDTPSTVLTFDDGFQDIFDNAWPLLRARELPFTVYLASKYVGGTMHWDGSTAKAAGPALTWDQLAKMVGSGLCTIGNHTHSHVRPEQLTEAEFDRCSNEIEQHLGVRPRHFTYPWGVSVPAMEPSLRARFLSASTGRLGRNLPGTDLMRLRRVPVRRTDPIEFFRAKLAGGLGPERAYAGIVHAAKAVGARA
jgi:peptidoglycan/xylan/chitin deacetylase (PgdA/CDA1 family)